MITRYRQKHSYLPSYYSIHVRCHRFFCIVIVVFMNHRFVSLGCCDQTHLCCLHFFNLSFLLVRYWDLSTCYVVLLGGTVLVVSFRPSNWQHLHPNGSVASAPFHRTVSVTLHSGHRICMFLVHSVSSKL